MRWDGTYESIEQAEQRNREQAMANFLAYLEEAENLTAQIAAYLDEHCEVDPDNVTWGDVGSLGYLVTQLREIAVFIGKVPEHE